MKNQAFRARLGFAIAGIGVVWKRERSFRTHCRLAILAIAATIALRPAAIWAALIVLAIGVVLALEAINAALEYLLDHLHPEIAEPIKCAKDAAAGAVLIASLAALGIAALMLVASAPSGL